jgi:hypothetical protein
MTSPSLLDHHTHHALQPFSRRAKK